MLMVVIGLKYSAGETNLIFETTPHVIMTRKEVEAADDSLKKVMVSDSSSV
jgi:hypothetical protein